MKNPLCRFRHALGRPGEGAHAPRVPLTGAVVPGGLALVDVLLTVAAAYGASRAAGVPFVTALLVLVVVAVVAHAAFCVPTALNVALGIATNRDEEGVPPFAESPAKVCLR